MAPEVKESLKKCLPDRKVVVGRAKRGIYAGRHIQFRKSDKAGGIDEYLLKTSYNKMDTEMGLFWKAKIEKMYEELGDMEVTLFSPEDEAKFDQGFKVLKLDERAAHRESRRKNYSGSRKQKQIGEGKPDAKVTKQEVQGLKKESPLEQMVANS
ncbi:hypothetical protein HHK36_020192 [Tetracentron sinense]|uniref:Uncharacterized protein n=1 Tax=Tetracentron sinense TaxID=13715 RepID=A0A834YV07_TETSI|nr:hypothetical protein HHK36_020192 [Tetracentron sinense]